MKPATDPQLLLIFDGDCAFCSSAAQWVFDRVPVKTMPYQQLDLAQFGLSRQHAEQRIWVIKEAGTGLSIFNSGQLDASYIRGGGRAGAWLLQHARNPLWRAVGFVVDLPLLRIATEVVYQLVARNRHKLPGGTAVCEIQ